MVFEKVTLPGKGPKTIPTIPSSIERPAIAPTKIDQLLLKFEKKYDGLIENLHTNQSEEALSEAVTSLLEEAERLNIRIGGLASSLMRDLKIPASTMYRILERTRYVKKILDYISRWNKREKKDPIKYAEAIAELVDLVGSCERATAILAKKTEIKDSTIQGWCKVSRMPDEIKELISEDKLPPTTAFEIPMTNADKQIEIAAAISKLPQGAAKKVLNYIKTHPDEDPMDARMKVLNN